MGSWNWFRSKNSYWKNLVQTEGVLREILPGEYLSQDETLTTMKDTEVKLIASRRLVSFMLVMQYYSNVPI